MGINTIFRTLVMVFLLVVANASPLNTTESYQVNSYDDTFTYLQRIDLTDSDSDTEQNVEAQLLLEPQNASAQERMRLIRRLGYFGVGLFIAVVVTLLGSQNKLA